MRFVIPFIVVYSVVLNCTSAQVYNYDPIRHTNFETNPAYLSSDKNKFVFSWLHSGFSLSNNRFYSETIRYSVYNASNYTGAGLVAGFYNYGKNQTYTYAGAGLGYRTIFFNRVYVRVGLLYKFLYLNSNKGAFEYYSLKEIEGSEKTKQSLQSLNGSVSFSSARDRYYMSLGSLNHSISQTTPSNLFPNYYFVNLGDFGRILNSQYLEISYTGFISKRELSKAEQVSHYITFLYSGFHLTRMSSLKWGGRFGIENKNLLRFNPSLAFIKRLHSRKFFALQLMLDAAYSLSANHLAFPINPQINISYFL